MYYIIGAAFSIGFIVGMAFGIVRGKKELADELNQKVNNNSQDIQKLISEYLK
jgi:hypothetical protein